MAQPGVPATLACRVLLALSEFLIVAASYVGAAFLVLPFEAEFFLTLDGGAYRISVLAASVIVLIYFHDLYTNIRVASRIRLGLDLVNVFGFAMVIQAFLTYTHIQAVPARIVFAGSPIAMIIIPCWRLLYGSVIWNLTSERILVVGSSPAGREMVRGIERQASFGWVVLGFVDDDPDAYQGNSKWLGPFRELRPIALASRPSQVIVTLPSTEPSLEADLNAVAGMGIPVEPLTAMYEAVCGRVSTSPVSRREGQSRVAPLQSRPSIMAIQSIYMNLFALALVLCSIPLMLLVAAAIKLSSPGPVTLGQTCVGFHGIPFWRLRFRCWRTDRRPDGSVVRSLTWIGRLLLRYRLQGLPQSINVLRGEMSLVGPEPERVEFSNVLASRIPAYNQRYTVKPGIIGWSQIKCDDEALPGSVRRLEYDLYYAKHVSPVLDLIIFLLSLKALAGPRIVGRQV